MKNISILCPSRDRHEYLKQFVRSIVETVSDLSTIELLFVVDNDDFATQELTEELRVGYIDRLDIKTYIIERTDFVNSGHYNFLASKSTGKFIFCAANDLILTQKDWDKTLLIQTEEFLHDKPDRIAMISLRDSTPAPGIPPDNKDLYTSFPIITREAFNCLGWVLPGHVPSWGTEKLMHRAYSTINRLLFIKDKIYINHFGYHADFKNNTADPLTERMGLIQQKYAQSDIKYRSDPDSSFQRIWLAEQINKLSNHINNYGAK